MQRLDQSQWEVMIALAIILAVTIVIALRLRHRSAEDEDTETSAPEIKPFANPITFSILMACILSIGIGLIWSFSGNFWGVILGAIGVFVWWKGDTYLNPDEREAGLLTIWGSPLKFFGKPIMVMGRTILADWFPFFLGAIRFHIKNRDKDFEMELVSSDNQRFEGVLSLTLIPNTTDPVDYIQAGKMDDIFGQLDDIVYQLAQAEARRWKGERLAQHPELISDPLRRKIENKTDWFAQKDFGVRVIKVQARFRPVETVRKAMDEAASEVFQRQAELAETDTDVAGAMRLHRELGLPMDKAMEQYLRLRLIRDNMLTRIESAGNGGNLNINTIEIKGPQGKKGK